VKKTTRGTEHIYLDVATIMDRNMVHGGRTELPWSLVFKHQIPARFKDAEFYVPRPEVLLLLKAKAALDREYDAKRVFDPYYLQQKAWKDYYDIASLLKVCTLDGNLIIRLLKAHGFSAHFDKAVSSLARKRSVMARHDVTWSELRMKSRVLR